MRLLVCEYCEKNFTNIRLRRFCSKSCVGKKGNSGQFNSCSVPWNKGKTGVQTNHGGGYPKGKIAGQEHHLFKGEEVGYSALHAWVYRHLGSPKECENCGRTEAKRFEWANLSGKYKRDFSDWARLCPVCHHLIDDITVRGWKTRRLI